MIENMKMTLKFRKHGYLPLDLQNMINTTSMTRSLEICKDFEIQKTRFSTLTKYDQYQEYDVFLRHIRDL